LNIKPTDTALAPFLAADIRSYSLFLWPYKNTDVLDNLISNKKILGISLKILTRKLKNIVGAGIIHDTAHDTDTCSPG
jgi:hypothetical protein